MSPSGRSINTIAHLELGAGLDEVFGSKSESRDRVSVRGRVRVRVRTRVRVRLRVGLNRRNFDQQTSFRRFWDGQRALKKRPKCKSVERRG